MKRVQTIETHHCDMCGVELPGPNATSGEHFVLTRVEHYDHPHSGGETSDHHIAEFCRECGVKRVLPLIKAIDGIPWFSGEVDGELLKALARRNKRAGR